MAEGDLPRVGTIERASFTNPWKEGTFRGLLRRPRSELWVAELPGEGVVGYFVLWWILDEAELANVAVAPEHRRRGVGSALLDRVLERVRERDVRSLFLEVRASNDGARALYESRGFQVMAMRRRYYQRPEEDALVMVKTFT